MLMFDHKQSKLHLPENVDLDNDTAKSKLKLGLFSYPVLQAADILVHGYAYHSLLCSLRACENRLTRLVPLMYPLAKIRSNTLNSRGIQPTASITALIPNYSRRPKP